MKQADRLKLLQRKLALLQLQKAAKAQGAEGSEGHPLRPGQEIPPIRIELAVSAQNALDKPQPVVNHVSPMPG